MLIRMRDLKLLRMVVSDGSHHAVLDLFVDSEGLGAGPGRALDLGVRGGRPRGGWLALSTPSWGSSARRCGRPTARQAR